jgi:hypothetical protein
MARMGEHGDGWVSVAEAERISGRKRRTLRRYAHDGRLQVRYADDGSVLYHAGDLAVLATVATPAATPDHPRKQTADTPTVEIIELADPPDGHPNDDVASPAQMAHQVGVLRGQLAEVRADRDYWRELAAEERTRTDAARERAHAAELALAETLAKLATPGHPTAEEPRPATVDEPRAAAVAPTARRPWWRRLFGRT